MKASVKDLAASRRAPIAPVPTAEPRAQSYRTAQTRENTRQLAAHFPDDVVHDWRVLAAEQDMDSQELMAVALNMVFERFGKARRIEIVSGRRKRRVA